MINKEPWEMTYKQYYQYRINEISKEYDLTKKRM